MNHLPAPGKSGPRRALTLSEAKLARMLQVAADELTVSRKLADDATRHRQAAAQITAEAHAAGVTLAQVASVLGVTRVEAQRLVERGRTTV